MVRKIGIIGCGHFGRALAQTFLEHGYLGDKLLISYGGSPATLEKIKEAGLMEHLADNQTICDHADVIFITIPPQGFVGLKGLHFKNGTTILSCMAGVNRSSFKKLLDIDVLRMMPSGPDTISQGKGIAGIYPSSHLANEVLKDIGITLFEMPDEESLHIFTTAVCLPAALLCVKEGDTDIEDAVKEMKKIYAGFDALYIWAKNVLPNFNSPREKEDYIKRMVTKGGITEIIVEKIQAGETLLTALKAGIERGKRISERANQLVDQV